MLWYIFPIGSHPAFRVASRNFSPTSLAGVYESSLSGHLAGKDTMDGLFSVECFLISDFYYEYVFYVKAPGKMARPQMQGLILLLMECEAYIPSCSSNLNVDAT